jgi:hypothetical protein
MYTTRCPCAILFVVLFSTCSAEERTRKKYTTSTTRCRHNISPVQTLVDLSVYTIVSYMAASKRSVYDKSLETQCKNCILSFVLLYFRTLFSMQCIRCSILMHPIEQNEKDTKIKLFVNL